MITGYKKIYCDFFGYTEVDFIHCELGCGAEANDVHHIRRRGMGGTTKEEHIDNLMALCRKHHDLFGDKTEYMEMLEIMHTYRMQLHIVRKEKSAEGK